MTTALTGGLTAERSANPDFRCEGSYDPQASMWIEITAGPDSGWGMELSPGRHLIGRARHCGVVIDDPAIEANHLLLDVDHADRFDALQLAGRVPIAVAADHVQVGDSRIHVTRTCESDPGLAAPDRPHSGSRRRLALGVRVATLLEPGEGEPVFLDTDSLVIVDDHPELARAHAIVRSLGSQAAAMGLTAPDCLLTVPDDLTVHDHPTVLEIGARWRARLMRADESIRLHAAGRSPRSYMNTDARRSAILQPSSVRSNRSANSPTR